MKQSHSYRNSAIYLASAMLVGSFSGCANVRESTQNQSEGSWHSRSAPHPAATVDSAATNEVAPERVAAPLSGRSSQTDYFGVASDRKASDSGSSTGIKEKNKRVELNFQDADVRSVVGSVLGDMLKLSYTIDTNIQGKITLRTGRPISEDSALPALEAALSTVSAAIVMQGGVVQVVPLESAPQRMHSAQKFDPSLRQMPGFAVEVIPLRYVGAKEMQRVLEAFAPKGSILQIDEAHNHIVIAGTSVDRSAIEQTISGFDTDAMQGMNFALYHLDHVTPDQLVTDLKQIFQPPMELVTQRVRLVPIPRLQLVLGVSKYRADLEMLESWVAKLDRASKAEGRHLYVYDVQHGSAKELAKSLRLVMTGEGAGSSGDGPQGKNVGQMPTEKLVAQPPATAQGEAFSSPFVQNNNQSQSQSRIVANEENNSLLIFGTDEEYHGIKDALRHLDVAPRQVMIEAMIAEVTLGDTLNYGVQWAFHNGDTAMTLTSSSNGVISSQGSGFSYIYSGIANTQLILNALQSKTDVKILSAPKLAVLNNQKAELLVGDQIPVLTQTSQGTTAPGAPVISTIEMRDTGISLSVTPRISENGNIILDVAQEVSDVTTTTSSGINSPTIQRRRLHSMVATHDGATVALGGLIREQRNGGASGLPVLSNLPVVGNLFKSNTSSGTRTELIVLLVPHVMRDPVETQAVVDALLESMPASSELSNHAPPVQTKSAK